MIESLFHDIPVTKKSWIQEATEKEKVRLGRDNVPPNVVSYEYFYSYPSTPENSATYVPTGEEPVCLVRLGYGWEDAVFKQLSQAVYFGTVMLGLKTYCYPTYPILQFVLRIHPENYQKPWFQETLGEIQDGDIQGFIVDLCRLLRWKLVLARYDPLQEKRVGGLISSVTSVIPVSPDQVQKYICEAQSAVAHYWKIQKAKLNFKQAADSFIKDNVPIEGVDDKADFITNCINHGTAECIVPIKSLFEVMKKLLQAMKRLGLPSEEVIALQDRNLKCICPQCGYTIDGAGLGTAYIVYTEGLDNVHLTGRSDKLRRLLSGCCVNNSCSSQEVTLRWQDDLKVTANWILNKFPLAMKPKNQEGQGV